MLWLVKQSTLTWLLFRFYVVEQRYLNCRLLSNHRVRASQGVRGKFSRFVKILFLLDLVDTWDLRPPWDKKKVVRSLPSLASLRTSNSHYPRIELSSGLNDEIILARLGGDRVTLAHAPHHHSDGEWFVFCFQFFQEYSALTVTRLAQCETRLNTGITTLLGSLHSHDLC